MTDKPDALRESLQTYVKSHPQRGKCYLCQLPIRSVIDEEARAGAPHAVILRWLKLPTSEGGGGHPEVTASHMRHHFTAYKHHELQGGKS